MSNIDVTKPTYGNATTQSVRDNFGIAKTEIDALQTAISGGPFLPLVGGTLGNGTDTPTLTCNGAAGGGHGLQWQTANTMRWQFITDAADNLCLYAFSDVGGYNGTAAEFHNDASEIVFNFKHRVTSAFAATAAGEVGGFETSTTNTGTYPGQGVKFGYFGQSARNGFETGVAGIAIFDPVAPIAGQSPAYNWGWLVSQSPNSSAPWGCNIAEMNIVNRGPDGGWMRDRAGPNNPTGCLLAVPEVVSFGGTGGGEGKNATYAYSVSRSGGSNSTGFPAKFYNAFLAEPNCVVGGTGRAFYATGDITGVASQYPYGPMQTDGTWLHGIDHTRATYQDNSAETLAMGQAVRWIAGPTTAPTAIAAIDALGTGFLRLMAASGQPVYVGDGTGLRSLTINGAAGQNNGINWQTANNTRWRLITDASDNLNLYAYGSGGGYSGTILTIAQGPLHVDMSCPLQASAGFGAFGAGPIVAKPAVSGAWAGNTAGKALSTALAAYGLIIDNTTA